ncbi:MAG TPA: hypothetical protein VFB25_14105 [Gaiellaceae bacterium]|nr:hypothetical protein [Gaiellaceae bacterium]
MLAESFRLVTARLIPRPSRCKQAALLLPLLILAGCGGSGHPKAARWETISTDSFRFQAPHGWPWHTRQGIVAASNDSELVQVAPFPLAKTYTTALFGKVQRELMTRMRTVAQQTDGRLTGRNDVTVAGIKSHLYDVTVGDHVDEYTFVLRGKREFQLLCRRKKSNAAPFCEHLLATFKL